MSDILILISS